MNEDIIAYKEFAKKAFKENNKETFEDMNLNIDDGIKILDVILNSSDNDNYIKMSTDIISLKIKNTEKIMSTIMAILLRESAYNNTEAALESGYILTKNIAFDNFKKKIFEVFITFHLMNQDKGETEKLTMFFIALNLLATSEICPIDLIVKLIVDVCKIRELPISSILESFYDAFAFYVNPDELKDVMEKSTNNEIMETH